MPPAKKPRSFSYFIRYRLNHVRECTTEITQNHAWRVGDSESIAGMISLMHDGHPPVLILDFKPIDPEPSA